MFLNRFLKRIISNVELIVTTGDQKSLQYGAPISGRAPIAILIKNQATARAIGLNPALRAGEAWMNGRLEIEGGDILSLLDLIGYNLRWYWGNKNRVALWPNTRWLTRLMPRNDGTQAKANVAHHYDLSDRLYDLFLDKDRQYSCAYFTEAGNSLDQAQQDRLRHIATKLCLQPGQHVLRSWVPACAGMTGGFNIEEARRL